MASTAIPAVKVAIEEILAGADGLENTLVTRDYAKAERKPEHIWIWKAKAKRDPKGIGRRPARLEEEIRVTLRAVAIGGDAAAAEARVFELVEAAETALRDESRLAGSIVLFSHVEELEEEPLNFDTKVGCHVLMTVVAKTRI
jgi:hypothetical protein